MRTLRMKPRRTASGVATITVITKPWKCSSDCLYCPNDLRMPKSYLHAEPACQRAERNFFDPYLQVASRLRALEQMGHLCDKVELIVLGGTWSDYPISYQTWFVFELFRALDDAPQYRRIRARTQGLLPGARHLLRRGGACGLRGARAEADRRRRGALQRRVRAPVRKQQSLGRGGVSPGGDACGAFRAAPNQRDGGTSRGRARHRDAPRCHHAGAAQVLPAARVHQGADRRAEPAP